MEQPDEAELTLKSAARPLEIENQAQFKIPTWLERLEWAVFPSRLCPLPDAPAAFRDVLHSHVGVTLGCLDRLRVLVTGRLVVKTRIVTEHEIGRTRSGSVVYPVWKHDQERT